MNENIRISTNDLQEGDEICTVCQIRHAVLDFMCSQCHPKNQEIAVSCGSLGAPLKRIGSLSDLVFWESGEFADFSPGRNPPGTREFLAETWPDERGGYCAVAVSIPGVVSQGETCEEATKNLCEAYRLMVESLSATGEPIPASSPHDDPVSVDSIRTWVRVQCPLARPA